MTRIGTARIVVSRPGGAPAVAPRAAPPLTSQTTAPVTATIMSPEIELGGPDRRHRTVIRTTGKITAVLPVAPLATAALVTRAGIWGAVPMSGESQPNHGIQFIFEGRVEASEFFLAGTVVACKHLATMRKHLGAVRHEMGLGNTATTHANVDQTCAIVSASPA